MPQVSLKSRFVLLCAGISVTLGMLFFGLLNGMAQSGREAQGRQLRALAFALGEQLAQQNAMHTRDVLALAASWGRQGGAKARPEMLLDTWVRGSDYDLATVLDMSGHIIATNVHDADGHPLQVGALGKVSYSDAPWFMAGAQTHAPEGGMFVGGLHSNTYSSQAFGTRQFGHALAAPILDANGTRIGVLRVDVSDRSYRQAMAQLATQLQTQGYPADIVLVSQTGSMWVTGGMPGDVDGPPKQELAHAALRGGSGLATGVDLQQSEVVGAFAAFAGTPGVQAAPWSVLVQMPLAAMTQSFEQAMRVGALAFVAIVALALLAAWGLGHGLTRKLRGFSARLATGSSEVAQASTQIHGASGELTAAATQQAHVIKQTAAAMDAVSVMVQKNAQHAQRSQADSQASLQAAERGQRAVQVMMDAIGAISTSETAIMQQVENSNARVGDIARVIAEIGNKTKVINDIVFQTKLLSFNASVEAARAGEHGKGFAVVAQEVGNLAQMSGNAAKEITAMLDGSVQKVQDIVEDTRRHVSHLLEDGRVRVDEGTRTAQACSEALAKITQAVRQVDQLIGEISEASRNEAHGVEQVSQAMNQLDQVTHSTSRTARATATSSQGLSVQAQDLYTVVRDLTHLLGSASGTHARSGPAREHGRGAPASSVSGASAATAASTTKTAQPKGQAALEPRTPKAASPAPASPSPAAPQPPVMVPSAPGHHPVEMGGVPSKDDQRFLDV